MVNWPMFCLATVSLVRAALATFATKLTFEQVLHSQNKTQGAGEADEVVLRWEQLRAKSDEALLPLPAPACRNNWSTHAASLALNKHASGNLLKTRKP